MRLLIIEDEAQIAKPLKKGLERQNYAVDWEADGQAGLNEALVNDYDCLILDLNLPGMDGVEVARKLTQEKPQLPILMLTARSQQSDKITGLEAGATDYLTKPFSFQELVLRVNSLIRISKPKSEPEIEIANLKIDFIRREIEIANEKIELTNKEFGILEYLIRANGRPVKAEELLEHVWDREVDVFSDTVKTTIKTLRQKIDPEKKIIVTKRGKGYLIEKNENEA